MRASQGKRGFPDGSLLRRKRARGNASLTLNCDVYTRLDLFFKHGNLLARFQTRLYPHMLVATL